MFDAEQKWNYDKENLNERGKESAIEKASKYCSIARDVASEMQCLEISSRRSPAKPKSCKEKAQ